MLKEVFAIPAVGALIYRIKDNKLNILVQERYKENEIFEKGLLELPAGKIREYAAPGSIDGFRWHTAQRNAPGRLAPASYGFLFYSAGTGVSRHAGSAGQAVNRASGYRRAQRQADRCCGRAFIDAAAQVSKIARTKVPRASRF